MLRGAPGRIALVTGAALAAAVLAVASPDQAASSVAKPALITVASEAPVRAPAARPLAAAPASTSSAQLLLDQYAAEVLRAERVQPQLAVPASAPAESTPPARVVSSAPATDAAPPSVVAPAHEPRNTTATTAVLAAPQPVAPAAVELNARAAGLLLAMNQERIAAGLAPLEHVADLTDLALSRSNDMVTRGYFAHVSPSGESWITLLKVHGIRLRSGGENLARVHGDEVRSVHVAITHLMDSPTHRSNILSAAYTEVGVAAVTDADGVTVFTTIFAQR